MWFRCNGNFKVTLKDFPNKRKGLQKGGPVQKFIDNEVMKQMSPMMPRREGVMIQSMISSTVIGSGSIRVDTDYAHFQYAGKVYIYEPTGSTWAPENEDKIPTARDLQYQGAPTRGAFYFDRMKKAKKDQILKGAQALANKL
nr:MAG TPA: Minor capsid protein [Caudoviricetes sp.]